MLTFANLHTSEPSFQALAASATPAYTSLPALSNKKIGENMVIIKIRGKTGLQSPNPNLRRSYQHYSGGHSCATITYCTESRKRRFGAKLCGTRLWLSDD